MKSALQKKKDNTGSTYWKNKADKAWGQLIHAMYDECAVDTDECSGRMEAHHIVSRSRVHVRHDVENGIMLCSLHHKYSTECSPHAGPVGFVRWLEINRPGKYDWALEQSRQLHHGKPDYKAAYKRLTKALELYR